ncbi:MAG: ShlB/FhaC/HecB family hemolysin secretion/activation protein [Planctomycetaceae bacterium]|nr:ShlB/FhaC/HecB family hemolysin secretion/activation protein [Planctomycetaceae bacterium]
MTPFNTLTSAERSEGKHMEDGQRKTQLTTELSQVSGKTSHADLLSSQRRCSARLIFGIVCVCCILVADSPPGVGQNFERYRPLTPDHPASSSPGIPQREPPPATQDDRVLIDRLDAVILLDSADRVSTEPAIDELTGLSHQFTARDSLVYSNGMHLVVQRHLGQPISLRRINQLSREIAQYYHRNGQPIVDVLIPEQRITGGTLQIVIIESRIGQVFIERGCEFDREELNRWIECTRVGDRIYESKLQQDLFWLNQSPFRTVTVDCRPGTALGTTDVYYSSHDVVPLRGYIGGDDTGVKSLNYGRLFAGVMYGNLFGRGGLLSYQYTTDQELQHLEAHSASLSYQIDRDYSVQTFGSWAAVSPMLGGGLSQQGESWQTGLSLCRHLRKDVNRDQNVNVGLDFKSTNNNLEFAGTNVANSNADLVQLRFGYQDRKRLDRFQYTLLRTDLFVGPGGQMTGSHSASAFNTIRPGATPDYVYARIVAEESSTIGDEWTLLSRFTGQLASERLLFSEMLGLGGYDSVRGFDQRTYNADSGWIINLEFGPRTFQWGDEANPQTLRTYIFTDLGNGYQSAPLPGENASTFAASSGLGLRYFFSDQVTARFDWGYGWEDTANVPRSHRAHIGLVWIPGPRP